MSDTSAKLSEKTSEIAKWSAGAGLLLMTGIVAWQVFARYVLNASPAWAEQAALLLMIWYVFFAAAAGRGARGVSYPHCGFRQRPQAIVPSRRQ